MVRRSATPSGSELDTIFFDYKRWIAVFAASSDNFILSDQIPIPIDVIII